MKTSKPNIIVFVPHDLGRHLHCYGIDTVKSPHIDRLAEEGVRFANSFCTAPQCSPARASLFTGRYPHNNGVMGLTHAYFDWALNNDEEHLVDILNHAGYHTAIFGWGHEFNKKDKRRFAEEISNSCTVERVEEVLRFLKRQERSNRPFFLECPFGEVHRTIVGFGCAPDYRDGVTIPPYLKEDHSAWEEFAYFQGAVKQLDNGVGQIIETLDRFGFKENTIVVFTCDHGIPFPRAKCSLYDPGIEVPLIIRWPGGNLKKGTVYKELISHIDVMPTLLDLIGLEIPKRVQGLSYAPLLRGASWNCRQEIFAELTYHDYCDPRRCIRTETHKLIVNFTTAPFFMDPSQQWQRKTLTKHPVKPQYEYHPPVELYDLLNDPLEFVNLVEDESYTDIKRELLARLYSFLCDTDDPILEGIPVSSMHRLAWKALGHYGEQNPKTTSREK